jgi:hypothetical protein
MSVFEQKQRIRVAKMLRRDPSQILAIKKSKEELAASEK